MASWKQIWHTVNRNAAGILVALTLAGAIVGTPVGVAIWILNEMDDLKTELRAELRDEIKAEIQASDQRQLAAIEVLIDQAVRAATEESRRESTSQLGRHFHDADGRVAISVLPDGQTTPAPEQ